MQEEREGAVNNKEPLLRRLDPSVMVPGSMLAGTMEPPLIHCVDYVLIYQEDFFTLDDPTLACAHAFVRESENITMRMSGAID